MSDSTKNMHEVLYEPDIVHPMVHGLPSWVDRLNAEEGMSPDAHQHEIVVQREIAARIKTWLPCASLVRQNEMVVRDGRKPCIPDVIIDNVGGGPWAILELKLLLADDRLSAPQIRHDLNKLSLYKTAYPDAHCIFLLIAQQERLQVALRSAPWQALPIRFDSQRNDEQTQIEFGVSRLINGTHRADAYASSVPHGPTRAFAFEVRSVQSGQASTIDRYRFTARMHALASCTTKTRPASRFLKRMRSRV